MAIDYNKLDDKALEAMLEVATDDNAAKIREILDSRRKIPAIPLKTKMSDRELAQEVALLRKKNLNKRCKLVPYGSTDLVSGTIKGVIPNHTDQKPYYTILDDGGLRHTIEAHSQLLEISNEIAVDPQVFSKAEWTAEQAIKDNMNYVGLVIEWSDARGEDHKGRVVSIIPDKRFKRAAVRIKEYRKSLDSLKAKTVYVRKLIDGGLEECTFSEDASTKLTRDGYEARLKMTGIRYRLPIDQKVELCRKEYDEALKVYNKAKDILEMRARKLADAEKLLKREVLKKVNMEGKEI